MTAIAIVLGLGALFWIAGTNFGATSRGGDAAAAPAESADSGSPTTAGATPPTADEATTDGSEFSSGK